MYICAQFGKLQLEEANVIPHCQVKLWLGRYNKLTKQFYNSELLPHNTHWLPE